MGRVAGKSLVHTPLIFSRALTAGDPGSLHARQKFDSVSEISPTLRSSGIRRLGTASDREIVGFCEPVFRYEFGE